LQIEPLDEPEEDDVTDVDELKQRFMETKDRLTDNLRALGHEVRSEVETTVDHAVDTVKAKLDVRDTLRANPWRTLGISVAAGLGLGLLFGSRRPRQIVIAAPPAPAPEPVVVERAEQGFVSALLAPALIQLARASVGQMLETVLETGVRKGVTVMRERSAHREDLH
jgi:ElaB/YqjD/DUF883 family membrane-anchored ribosome-binding protein